MRIIGVVPVVEVDDPQDGKLITVGLRQHCVRGKLEAVRRKEHMVCNFPGRHQILIHQRRRHIQGLARVIETGLVGGIDGKFLRRHNTIGVVGGPLFLLAQSKRVVQGHQGGN